jgi:hypothetical protein
MTVEEIEKRIKGMATRAYIFGAIVGLLLNVTQGAPNPNMEPHSNHSDTLRTTIKPSAVRPLLK